MRPGASPESRDCAPLRLVSATTEPRSCRTVSCEFGSTDDTGFCDLCSAVYVAARELRARLMARRRARLHAQHPTLFGALSSCVREQLLEHMAARGAERNAPDAFDIGGLNDFLCELEELGLSGRGLT